MGVGTRIKDFFLGGTSGAVMDVAEGVSNIVERWKPGDAKNHEMAMEVNEFVARAIDSARQHDKPANSGLPIVDGVVNGVNRLIRPWVTITVLGSLFGYWELPPPESIDPQYWAITKIILAFWFGGRLLVKDIPQGIKTLIR